MKAYAFYLLDRFRAGETLEDLAAREGIPADRIQVRLEAAARFLQGSGEHTSGSLH